MVTVLILVLRLLHILSAIAMLGGIYARQIVRAEAARSADVRRFAALTDAARRIESLLVIPGSTAVIVLGIMLGLVTGAPILGFLQGADRNWLLAANLIVLSMVVIIPVVFLPQRRRLEVALKSALETDRITADLRAVVDERSARLWHHYENVAGVIIVLLMTLKPF